MTPDYLPIALRVHTERLEREEPKRRRRKRKPPPRWGNLVILIDTETTTDATQALKIGDARVCRWSDDGNVEVLCEYLFYADDLKSRDPEGFRILEAYARTHSENRLRLLSLQDFMDVVFWPACKAHTLIVAFNLPFDLSRLALEWSEARDQYEGGFSLTFWYLKSKTDGKAKENRHRPRARIKHIDKKRALMGLSQPGTKGEEVRARLLDLKALTYVLTDESHALKTACDTFCTEHRKLETEHNRITSQYIDYNRNDVLLLQELLEKLRAEFDLHPIDLDPSKALSPAAMAKGYLKAMGIKPPMEKFGDLPREAFAIPMLSYYGGRAECHVRMEPVPIVLCDARSMYPTVNVLMDLFAILIAEKVNWVECTEEVQQFLDELTFVDCLKPATWKKLNFLAFVRPDGISGPVRGQYADGSDAFTIGVNLLNADVEIPFAGPDLALDKIRRGKAAQVSKAFRLVPEGQQQGLERVMLRGAVKIDPRTENPFKTLVEERQLVKNDPTLSPADRGRLDLSLKVVANSGAYGINAELRRIELLAKQTETITVYGLNGPFRTKSRAPEEPGLFYFPPLASLVTAGARLMLGLFEGLIIDAGGTFAFCDTDSIAVVSTEQGGDLQIGNQTTHALSWEEVERIRDQLRRLNPYDPKKVGGSVFKCERENFVDKTDQRRQLYAYAISAKRYVLFNLNSDGSFEIRKKSEHGLGHLQNPIDPDDETGDWMDEAWRYILSRALKILAEPPAWLDRPALSRVTASSPELLKRLEPRRGRKPYTEQIKPWNFLLTAHVAKGGHPKGADPKKFQLYAPYTTKAKRFASMLWTERYSGERFAITTAHEPGSRLVRVKSYRDVLMEFETHPETKSADSEGYACSRTTRGILYPREVHAAYIRYVGKESNLIEEVESGLVHDWDQARVTDDDPKSKGWHLVVPILKKIPRKDSAQATGLSAREVRRICNGRVMPMPAIREKLLRVAAAYARAKLGYSVSSDDLAACAIYCNSKAPRPKRSGPNLKVADFCRFIASPI